MALQNLLRVLRRVSAVPTSPFAVLLTSEIQDTDEKVVIVSHYTATLNIIEKFCARKKYTSFRLDGLARNSGPSRSY